MDSNTAKQSDEKKDKTEESEFIEKEFKEVEGGKYDEYGFYYTPNGSKPLY